jgi:hypothetical protein
MHARQRRGVLPVRVISIPPTMHFGTPDVAFGKSMDACCGARGGDAVHRGLGRLRAGEHVGGGAQGTLYFPLQCAALGCEPTGRGSALEFAKLHRFEHRTRLLRRHGGAAALERVYHDRLVSSANDIMEHFLVDARPGQCRRLLPDRKYCLFGATAVDCERAVTIVFVGAVIGALIISTMSALPSFTDLAP